MAYDGLSALQAAAEFFPDCVFSDLDMPGLDGFALARRLREKMHLKLFAVSGRAEELADVIAEAGFDESLAKPADPSMVAGILAMMDQIKELASQTRDLAQQNVALAGDANQLLDGVKKDVQHVKSALQDTQNEVRQLKTEVHELKKEKKENTE